MFVQVIQGKVSDPGRLRAALDRWEQELAPGAAGYLGSTAGVTDDGRFVAVVRFASEDEARRNGERPEQDAWWSETATLFGGTETFHDSTSVAVDVASDPDTAGFVQVFRGRSKDPARTVEIMGDDEGQWNAFRPEILGSIMVQHADDSFTDVVYFTSEEAARSGEQKELPPELQAKMDELMALTVGELEYFDLTTPWLHSKA